MRGVHDLPSKLAKARQQLQKAQSRVAELEAQLFEKQPNLAKLASHKDHSHRTLDTLLEGCQIIGFDWTYLYVNDAATLHGQHKRDELLGYTMMERYPGIENTPMFAALERCMQERRVERIENEFTYPDGASVWFELSVQPVPEGIFILSQDISQRKQVETTVKRYAQRMEILHEIDLTLIQGGSVQALVATVVRYISQLIPSQRVDVVLLDEANDEALIFAVATEGDTSLGEGVRVPIPPNVFEGYDTRHIRVFDDIRIFQETRPRAKQLVAEGLLSSLSVLLMDQERPIGVLGLFAKTAGVFTDEHQEIASEIASQLAIAFKQLKLSEGLAQHTATLEEMHQFSQTTLDAFPANTAVLDVDGTIITSSLAWRRFADENGAASHYMGDNYLAVCDAARGAKAEEAPFAAAGIRAVISGERDDFYLEYPCNSRHKKRWFMLRVTPFPEPAPRRVVVAHINITERKLAEKFEREQRLRAEALVLENAQLLDQLEERVQERTNDLQAALVRVEAILNNSPDAILLADADFSIQQANFSFNKLFGSEWDEYFGKSLGNLLHPEDAATIKLPQIIANQADGKQIEVRAIRKDGTAFDAELSIAVIKGDGLVCIIRDITERKAQERQLRYHASLQESVSEAVIVSDLEFRIQSWNRAAEQIYGWTAEEIIGQLVEDSLKTDFENAEARTRFRQAFLENGYWSGEAIQHHKNGTAIPLFGSITLLKDNWGIPFGIISVVHDITERKAHERQLRYHASLQESVSDAVIVTDLEFRIQTWNKAAERIYGWTAAEAIGKVAPEFLQIRYSSNHDPEAEFKQFSEHGFIQQETIQRHKDGTHIFILGSATRLEDEKGVPSGIIAVNRDITELKAHERQLRYHASLQESVSDAVIVTNTEFRIQSWNKAAERIYGWSAEEVINKATAEILQTEYPSSSDQASAIKQLREQGWWQGEIIQHHKDGNKVHILGSVTLVKDKDGLAFAAVAVNHDISERKRTEEVLRQSEERFASVFRFSPVAIGLTTAAEGRYLDVNDSLLKLLGYSRDEMIGRTASDLNVWRAPEEREVVLQTMREKGSVSGLELGFRQKTGEICTTLTSIVPVVLNGQSCLLSIVQDITERKRAELTLNRRFEEEREFQGYLKALHEISIELTQIDELDLCYRRVVELGLERLGFERLALFLYDEQDGSAIGTYGTDIEGNLVEERGVRFSPDADGIMLRAFERDERFYLDDHATLYDNEIPIGSGWNAARVLWNGTRSLGWLVADNLLSQKPASKPLLDILGLYALTVATLLAQKQAQIALRESEERFRQIAENFDQVLYMASVDHQQILYINPHYENLYGRSAASVYEKPDSFVELVHPDDLEMVRHHLAERRYVEEGFADFEYRIIPPDGLIHWVRIRAFPIMADDGSILRRAGIIEDITASKKVAAELERQRVFLRNVIDVSPSLIFVKDYDGRFVLANPTLAQLHNATPEFLIGKSDAEINPLLDEVENFVEADRRVIDTGKPLFLEELVTDAHGLKHWFHTTKVQISSADGDSKHVLGIATDITELKNAETELRESEARFRMLVDAAPVAIVITRQSGHISLVNNQAQSIFGYERDEMLEQPVEILLPNYMHERHIQHRSEYLAAPTLRPMGSGLELQAKRKDNTLFPVEIELSYIKTRSGLLVMSFVVDITKRKEAEVALLQALAKEKELGELKTRFVSMASHEFRTPLATILALVETLSAYRKRLSEDQIEQRFDKIKEQVARLKDIMEDVLMLARMQARRVEFNPANMDLDNLVRSVLDEYESRVDVRHRLEYTVAEGNYELLLDRKLMRQITSNLVSNAIKYSPEDKLVRINLEYSDSIVTLTISDEGIGIPQADLPHLFEPFHRATNVGTISGTGLGLVITREAVELHRGTITVESQQDKGTTFIVRIPTEGQRND